MPKVGRPESAVWKMYDKTAGDAPGQFLAKCKGCGHKISNNTYRLRRHASSCSPLPNTVHHEKFRKDFHSQTKITQSVLSTSSVALTYQVQPAPPTVLPPVPLPQVCRTIYSLNLPFAAVEDPQLKLLFQRLAPGYKLPHRNSVGTKHLEEEYSRLREKVKATVSGTYLTMNLDGWTGPEGQAMLGITVGDFCFRFV